MKTGLFFRSWLSLWLSLGLALGFTGIARAENFSLDDVALSFGDVKIQAKKLEATDAALSKSEFTLFLQNLNGEDFQTAFLKLKCGRVVLSEVGVETASEGLKTVGHYKNLVLDGLEGGRARALVLTEGVTTTQAAQDRATTSLIGAYEAKTVDIIAAFRQFATGARDQSDREPRLLAASIEARDAVFIPSPDYAFSVGRIAISNFYARSLLAPVDSLFDWAPKESKSSPTSERKAALRLAALDVANAYRFDWMELENIRKGALSRADEAPASAVLTIDKIRLDGFRDAGVKILTFEGSFSSESLLRIGRAVFTDLDVKPMIEVLGEEPPRLALPRFSSFTLDKVDERMIALNHMRIDARGWRNAAPDYFEMTFDGFESKDIQASSPLLAALGVKKALAGGVMKTAYQEESRSWKLTEFKLEIADLYRFSGALDLANVDKSLFDGRPEDLKSAAAAVQFSRAMLRFDDLGLLDKLTVLDQGKNTRAQTALAASAVAIALLGSSPKAQTLGDAIAKLCRDGKSLTIDLVAPRRIGLVDVISVAKPGDLLEQLEIETKNQ